MNHVSKQSRREGVTKTPGICGGRACIERTRIPVWLLYEMHENGASDTQLIEQFEGLNQFDLDCAWRYVAQNQSEIDEAIRQNDI
jgi:uncharacterized protein (DUF433 family)